MHHGRARASSVMATFAATMIVACGGGHGKQPPSLQARGGTLPPLMATVPADAGMVLYVAPGLVEMFPDAAGEQFRAELRAKPDASGTVSAAVGAELMNSASIPEAIGWRPGKSEVVMWAKGKTFVVRARIDGVALRGLIARGEQQSGEKITRATWHDRAYLTWTGNEQGQVYARIDDEELVAVISESREQALPLLMDEVSPARAFDPQPVIAALFPGRADAHFGAMIDPAWILELASDALGRDGFAGLGAEPDCVAAAMGMVAGLPPFHYAWARSDAATEVAAAIKLPPETAALLERGLAPIPHWPIDERHFTFGVGLSVRTAVEVARPLAERLDQVAQRCGQPPQVAAALGMLAAVPAVTQVERASMVMEPRTEQFAMAVTPTDLPRFWAALGSLAPLRPLPPAIGERLRVPGAMVTSDGTSLLMTQGAAAEDEMLRTLEAAPPGPAAIVAMVMGKGSLAYFAAEDDDEDSRQFLQWVSGMALEVGVHDGHLVGRAVFRHR